MTRQQFLRHSGMFGIVAGLLSSKPSTALTLASPEAPATAFSFTTQQKVTISAVLIQLFPADGDGPSAQDLNALNYLQWALQDPDNVADGDQQLIPEGSRVLEDEAAKQYKRSFVTLDPEQQDELLRHIAGTPAGENWISLLLYYLIEALTLDPVYGGNPNGAGWKWLEHQPGFPRPTADWTYLHYK